MEVEMEVHGKSTMASQSGNKKPLPERGGGGGGGGDGDGLLKRLFRLSGCCRLQRSQHHWLTLQHQRRENETPKLEDSQDTWMGELLL